VTASEEELTKKQSSAFFPNAGVEFTCTCFIFPFSWRNSLGLMPQLIACNILAKRVMDGNKPELVKDFGHFFLRIEID